MADTIRQKIVNALKARMATILISNGYATDAGQRVEEWMVVNFAEDDLPATAVKDPDDAISVTAYNTHAHKLSVEITVRASGVTVEADLRLMVADIHKAIGTDPQWITSDDAALGNVTASNSGGLLLLSLAGNALEFNDMVHFATTGALPAGLHTYTNYYVVAAGDPGFKVSATKGGTAISYTDAGTGIHSVIQHRPLATSTEVLSDAMAKEQHNKIIGEMTVRLQINFETVLWDAYNQ